jgi:hypothetical protein
VTALLLAFALLAASPAQPWPIGPGPRYVPPPAPPRVVAGKPVGGLRCTAAGPVVQLHVELFANRRVVVLPAGIGVAGPAARHGATVVPRGCTYPVRTLNPAGIVEVGRGASLRLSDLFRVWGQALGARRLASFRSALPVRAYVDGKLVDGPAGSIPLTAHAEIVVELGAYVPPHPFFLFAGGGR